MSELFCISSFVYCGVLAKSKSKSKPTTPITNRYEYLENVVIFSTKAVMRRVGCKSHVSKTLSRPCTWYVMPK